VGWRLRLLLLLLLLMLLPFSSISSSSSSSSSTQSLQDRDGSLWLLPLLLLLLCKYPPTTILLLLLWLLLLLLEIAAHRRCFSPASVEEGTGRGQKRLLVVVSLVCALSLHCHGVPFAHELHKGNEHVLGCGCADRWVGRGGGQMGRRNLMLFVSWRGFSRRQRGCGRGLEDGPRG
jgi:hypothetical protein